jgi:hypothetical protein
MMPDTFDAIRHMMIESGQVEDDLATTVEPTWDTEQMKTDFEVLGFLAPFVVVRRKSDGKNGSLEFTHNPRVYFNWTEDA